MTSRYLAIDLGAETGRVMLGTLESGRVSLKELSRFSNEPLRDGDGIYWNIPALIEGVRNGLVKAGALGHPITSVSADAWGVDYVLIDNKGEIMEPVFHYRHPRTIDGEKKALVKVDWPTLFDESGVQYMLLNTSIQLCSEVPDRLGMANTILTIADAFNYILSGVAKIEVSMASTTQLYNPRLNCWSDRLIKDLGLPRSMFPEVVSPATTLGPLKPDFSQCSGLNNINVVSSLSHDTACAVAACPTDRTRWAYISSGTWSLIGLELSEPILTDDCRKLNFTNEIGFGNSTRLLKNIIGLWLVQECRRSWANQGNQYSYEQLTEMAINSKSHQSVLNPLDPRFIAPDNMPKLISEICNETNQLVPTTPGEIIRCALESLALLYAKTLCEAEELVGWKVEKLHIVGGGSKNVLLNQLTADAANIDVIAGPAEATASGNVLVQAIANGVVSDLDEARQIVHRSFDTETFNPKASLELENMTNRFNQICTNTTL